MKLLFCNIQQGGGARVDRICAALIEQHADVILLSEFRTRPGKPLLDALVSEGWTHIDHTGPVGTDSGICALSRAAMTARAPVRHPLRTRSAGSQLLRNARAVVHEAPALQHDLHRPARSARAFGALYRALPPTGV